LNVLHEQLQVSSVLHLAQYAAVMFCYAVLAGNSTNIKWHEGGVTTQQKEDMLEQKGCVLWFTGLSGSGPAACNAAAASMAAASVSGVEVRFSCKHADTCHCADACCPYATVTLFCVLYCVGKETGSMQLPHIRPAAPLQTVADANLHAHGLHHHTPHPALQLPAPAVQARALSHARWSTHYWSVGG
jgi:hypothetical protein